jgi:uncharacterized protein YebE (UPF0316 family)
MSILLGALLIFSLRVVDVSIGTVRVLFVMRGKKWVAAGLGVLEAGVFITAMTQVFKDMSPPKMVGYAAGYAVGILVGISVEQWIAAGQVMLRVISMTHPHELRDRLRREGFGVTAVRGEGRQAEVLILFVVIQRKHTEKVLELIKSIDVNSFVTIDAITEAIGGYIPWSSPSPFAIKK